MPRIAAEARSALSPIVGKHGPRPPKSLDGEAKAIWKEIVGSRPADFFSPGNLELLAMYCRTMVQLQRVTAAVERLPETSEAYAFAVATMVKLNAAAISQATKLRLTIQSALRGDAGKNNERAKPAPLLGGNVTALKRA